MIRWRGKGAARHPVRTGLIRRGAGIASLAGAYLLAVLISFFVSGYLWFSGQRIEGVFTAIWVPAILGFAIYFKLMLAGARNDE